MARSLAASENTPALLASGYATSRSGYRSETLDFVRSIATIPRDGEGIAYSMFCEPRLTLFGEIDGEFGLISGVACTRSGSPLERHDSSRPLRVEPSKVRYFDFFRHRLLLNSSISYNAISIRIQRAICKSTLLWPFESEISKTILIATIRIDTPIQNKLVPAETDQSLSSPSPCSDLLAGVCIDGG